ncbi:hypothetical protein HJC23_004628 [Cyclotella cryptica]|uniref:Peripheral subunit-binding (PSBD) domain-containing protein n=1 Tax=Cyclotella cryptica TaxID=29204 RepID=A0ABD3QMB9_9STRA|eukprot:CCRYP_005949-RA/>CCRYP_005949-RA protein AED:0.00 eAED:0.00 QI:80/1/1/1/1/1/2/1318/653
MIFTITAVIIASAGIRVNGFSVSSFVPSFCCAHPGRVLGAQAVSLTVLKASPDDPYASLLKKLSEAPHSQESIATPSIDSANYDTLRDTVLSTLKAANDPVPTSADVSNILPNRAEISSYLNTNSLKTEAHSTFMADAQVKLSVLQQELNDIKTSHDDSYGFDITHLSASLNKALDVSIHAAEQATEYSLAAVAGSVNTETISHIIAHTHSKLAALEQQVHDKSNAPSENTEVDLTQLYAALNDALDASFHAAEKAAVSSLAVVAGSIDTEAISQIMAQTQSKFSTLERQLHDIRTAPPASNDADLTQFYAALNEARDVSNNVAKYASTSSSAVTDALLQFNIALGHSMSNIDLGAMMPSEMDDLIRRQTAVVLDGPMQDLEGVIMNWNRAWVQSLMNGFDRKFNGFSLENAFSSDTSVVMAIYGLLAFMLGYSQNVGAAEEGKLSSEEKLVNNNGEMKRAVTTPTTTLNVLSHDTTEKLAFQPANEIVSDALANKPTAVSESAKVKRGSFSSVDYDAAARLAYKESGLDVNFYVFRSLYLAEAAAMVAKKNPYLKRSSELGNSLVSAEANAATRLAYQASEKSCPDFPNPPLVSPLARSLAEEMGLELTRIGAGSGKNGRILAEDVRNFKSKMEQAKAAISQEAQIFSAANA